jgi:ribosomal protein S18 acetylase RimI-like enzyme
MFSLKENAIYIMTLGVIDEMRSRGLAKKLLDEMLHYTSDNPKVQLVTLHVVSYNKRAINFYKKNGFCLLEEIDDHYHIMGN